MQPEDVNICYSKLRHFDLTEYIGVRIGSCKDIRKIELVSSSSSFNIIFMLLTYKLLTKESLGHLFLLDRNLAGTKYNKLESH